MAKKIVFLPIWGKINQTIPLRQMEAIRNMGGEACYGLPGTFFPMTRSALRMKPDVISMDWIHQYCLDKSFLKSIIKSTAFLIDVLLVKWVLRKKLVWTIHNLQHHDPRPRKLERLISSIFAQSCDKVRLLGEGMNEVVCNRFGIHPARLTIIPEGSFTGYYPDNLTREEARKQLGIPVEAKVWLHFGAQRPYKGVEEILDFLSKNKPENTILVVAGTPFNQGYVKNLEHLANGNPAIKLFLKTIPDEDLQIFFQSADLVILPFKNVFNSSSIVLAMTFGKAVVAPALGMIPFRLQKQKELLYSPNEGLEAGLDRASKLEKNRLIEIGNQNRIFVNQFQWMDFAKMILTL
ncbi:MAG TPA: glycosyltransferase family 4 protein [Catalimonadaceae bacterium]|nr:glycosyltransferase family 4 protein [Catalimonadaceae bacterium]